MAIAGKGTVITVATTTGGTYNTVAGLNDGSMSCEGDNQDISTFGTNWIKRIQGLKDASYSLSGFYDPTDTNGQVRIFSAWLNDTALFVKFLADGTNGFKQEVKVSSFEMSSAVDGVVEVSIELEGTDTITAVP
jgi:predicted secreted protein